MFANYLEQRWFRVLISVMAFIPLLMFELYGVPWLALAYLAAMLVAGVILTNR